MPYRPWPRCMNCGTKFPHDGRGRKPNFCSPDCRIEASATGWRKCPRCGTAYVLSYPAQKFCSEECRYGCHYCGGEIPTNHRDEDNNVIHTRNDHTQDTYCSKVCRDAAWAGQPLPTCTVCHDVIELPVGGRARKDPPKAHVKCWRAGPPRTAADRRNKKAIDA